MSIEAMTNAVTKVAQEEYKRGFNDGRKQWVGLTDEEMNTSYRQAFGLIDSRMVGDQVKFVRAIEAKLKEKNT